MDEKQPLKKSNSNQLDFIIVGQGIAGSVLALSLIKSGYTVCVVDKQDLSLSSRIAAGIWNPVVFKRLAKSWLADDVVPELIRFYEFFEKELNASFVNRRFILKPFSEEQEKIFWLKKAESENEFLDKSIYEDFKVTDTCNIKSYSKVLQAGNIDMATFLDATKNYISKHQQLIEESFDYDALTQTEDGVTYKSVSAKHIIFCEGHLISKNPYFNWIPFKPAKGEVLTITCNDLHLENSIFNKGFFIMPLGNNTYKVGATYEWENLNDTPTESKKQELITKLNSVISSSYQIVKHEAGVRPSVIDRRPVVGCHPKFSNVYVFNGFGTKAVMLAPYFAKQLVNYIQYDSPIDAEVNPSRFYKEALNN
jgi:glycine/D-amino acid oxidase-like deaminating enzyme